VQPIFELFEQTFSFFLLETLIGRYLEVGGKRKLARADRKHLLPVNISPLNNTIRLSQVLFKFFIFLFFRGLIEACFARFYRKTQGKLISIEEVDLEQVF